MADWPGPDEVKRVLDVESQDWDDTLDRVLSAAISRVKDDVGLWDDDVDEPDDNLAQAALRMAELLALRPEAAAQASTDPTYARLLFGHRRRFGIA
jgi:hypothetical protein